jgi:hypothetical protein
MGSIRDITIAEFRNTISNSNKVSFSGNQKYVAWESKAIQDDYEFLDCMCKDDCWCKRTGCTGHYRIREINFNQFINTYVHLWIPERHRKNVKDAVLGEKAFKGREKEAIPHLRWLMLHWDETLNRIRQHDKSGLCNNGIPKGVFNDNLNLYKAKMWSQLYYDCFVPFDTKSCINIKKAGYANPKKEFAKTNVELFNDLKIFATKNNLSVIEIRNLDQPWSVSQELPFNKNGQPLSRVLDKLFYSP